MKVVCKQRCSVERQNISLDLERDRSEYELTVGRLYTVLGISFQSVSPFNRGTAFLLRDDIGRCAFVPICMLEISNATSSKYWAVRAINEFDCCLWPEEFFPEYFHDDLSDGVPEVVAVFDGVCRRLDLEEAS